MERALEVVNVLIVTKQEEQEQEIIIPGFIPRSDFQRINGAGGFANLDEMDVITETRYIHRLQGVIISDLWALIVQGNER